MTIGYESLGEDNAMRLAESLFPSGEHVTGDDRLLIPSLRDGTLAKAVWAQLEKVSSEKPLCHVLLHPGVTREGIEFPDKVRGAVTLIDGSFLLEFSGLEDYDYVVEAVPKLQWGDFNEGRQESLLRRFESISREVVSDNASVHSVYLEKITEVLAKQGRAVVATPPVSDATNESVTEHLQRRLRRASVVGIEPFPSHMYESKLVMTQNEDAGRTFDYDIVEQELLNIYEPTAADVMRDDIETFVPEDAISDLHLTVLRGDVTAVPIMESGEITGYLSSAELSTIESGTARAHKQPLEEGQFVQPDVGFSTLLEELTEQRFLFVGEPSDFLGVVGRLDLNSLAVYQHLYTKLANFEISLKHLLRCHDINWRDRAIEAYPRSKVKRIEGRYERTRDSVRDVYDAMLLSELVTVAKTAGLVSKLNLTGGGSVSLNRLNDLRRDVAHYQPLIETPELAFLKDRRDVLDLADLNNTLDQVNERLQPLI